MKRCPYCGRRISYISKFTSRRKGEYVCARCGKESRVAVSKLIFLFFVMAVLISGAIGAGFYITENLSNPIGIILVAIPLVIFLFVSPVFLNFEPLKKYKKSMEARKARMEYSEKINTAEFEKEEIGTVKSAPESENFHINTNIFNEIKAERNAARSGLSEREEEEKEELKEESGYVPVIKNISENYASSNDVPLKKIHSDKDHMPSRVRHYVPQEKENFEQEKKHHDTNKYSANRKF